MGVAELSTLEWCLVLIYIVALGIFSMLANLFVVAAICTHPPLKIIPNYYLASLAVTDFLMGVSAHPLAGYYTLNGSWELGPLSCKVCPRSQLTSMDNNVIVQLWTFFSMLFICCSIFHITAIALDRLCAIVSPLGYGTHRRARHVAAAAALCWIVPIATLTPPYCQLFGLDAFSDAVVVGGVRHCTVLKVNKPLKRGVAIL